MAKRLLLACLACLATTVQAAPIAFFATQFDTSAVASAETAADFQSDSSPPSALPLISSAAAVGTIDIATAGAIAAPGLLQTSADAAGSTAAASAAGQSHFSGSFASGGPLALNLDFDPTVFTTGSGIASAFYSVLLTIAGTTVVNDIFTSDMLFLFDTPQGSTSFLELFLFSDASADGSAGSGGGSQASLAFSGEVPLPATLWLLLIGMAVFGMVQRRHHPSPRPA